ncbi:hypothetical protein D3C87_1884320 [compost metagenome]
MPARNKARLSAIRASDPSPCEAAYVMGKKSFSNSQTTWPAKTAMAASAVISPKLDSRIARASRSISACISRATISTTE